jgi:hypothetical protein
MMRGATVMFKRKTFKGFALGMLAATVVALGVWPALAYDNDQVLPAGYEPALHAGGSSDSSPDAEEPGSQEAAGGATALWLGSSPLVIPAAAFSSDGFDPDSFYFTFSGGYIRGTAAADGCVKAPVYLPDGATIDSVYAYLYDNDSSRNAYIDVRRVRNLTGVQTTMASVSTSAYGNSTSIRYLGDFTVVEPVVDDLYSYYVTTCFLSTNVRLYAVRIFYTESEVYLPLILKNY